MENNQKTEEWFKNRLGKVTASRVSDVMAKIKTGEAAARTNYKMQLLCERLTGKREETFTSHAMQRGTELETIARGSYEFEKGVFVEECGLIIHSDIKQFGASPDGLVGDDGCLEIKCPNTATHIDFLRTGKPDGKYIWQMMAQMACANRKWCDFVSFDDRLPNALQYSCVRIERDSEMIIKMITEIKLFLTELDELEQQMLDRMEQSK